MCRVSCLLCRVSKLLLCTSGIFWVSLFYVSLKRLTECLSFNGFCFNLSVHMYSSIRTLTNPHKPADKSRWKWDKMIRQSHRPILTDVVVFADCMNFVVLIMIEYACTWCSSVVLKTHSFSFFSIFGLSLCGAWRFVSLKTITDGDAPTSTHWSWEHWSGTTTKWKKKRGLLPAERPCRTSSPRFSLLFLRIPRVPCIPPLQRGFPLLLSLSSSPTSCWAVPIKKDIKHISRQISLCLYILMSSAGSTRNCFFFHQALSSNLYSLAFVDGFCMQSLS